MGCSDIVNQRAAVADHKVVNTDMQKQSVQNVMAVADLQPPPAENSMVERVQRGSGSGIKPKTHVTATSHSIASLQTTINNFSQEFLVGEGFFGRVYRAEYPNGKSVDAVTLTKTLQIRVVFCGFRHVVTQKDHIKDGWYRKK